ncbi:MAG TPA: GGDEF domain-containing protein [Spirochaetales bacterium]|nr:GGDEF domain-containing protein [Spirochaetales bacterium]
MNQTASLETIRANIAANSPATVSERARLWADAGLLHIESDPALSQSVIAELESMVDDRGFQVGSNWAKVIRAWQYIKRGEEQRGAAELRSAIAAFESHGEKRGAIRALNGLGVVYRYIGLLDRALEILKRAMAMAESLGWDELISTINTNLGLVYLDLHDWNEAALCLESATNSSFAAIHNLPIHQSHLAIAYTELERINEAEELIAKALKICRDNKFEITEADVMGKYAAIVERQGQHESAVLRYDESLALAKKLGNKRLMAEHGMARAKILFAIGRIDEAEQSLADAVDLSRSAGMQILAANALSELALVKAKRERWEEAYKYADEASKMERSLFGDKVANQAATFKAERESVQSAAYREELKRLSILSEIGMALAGSVDIESVGKILYERISALMAMDVFGLALYDDQAMTLDFRYFVEDTQRVEPFTLPADADGSLGGICARSSEPILISDLELDAKKYVKKPRTAGKVSKAPIRALIYYPVRVKDRTIGLISVQSRAAEVYQAHHLEIIKALSAYAGVALENARLFSELKSMAGTDPLTGALNRRRFMEVFASELQRVRRYCGKLGIILFDLDKFKQVNDRHGHVVGDLVLKEAVRRCSTSLRSNDYLARFGGEEFIIILPCTGLDGTLVVAERTRKYFESEPIPLPDGQSLTFTASFGCASLCEGDDLDSLTTRVDKAMYRAKNAGRNRVEFEIIENTDEGITVSGLPGKPCCGEAKP